jgi:vacuolar-type H+-ATPase subunit H
MAAEKSLLTKIREKELEMSVKIDEARTAADQAIEQAKKESSVLLSSSEAEGKKAASEFLRREMERIQGEADTIWAQAIEEVKKVRETGEKNIPNAVEKIVAIVLSG